MVTSANGLERESDLQDVYYAPGAHARLASLGKLEAKNGMSSYVMAGCNREIGMGTRSPTSRR